VSKFVAPNSKSRPAAPPVVLPVPAWLFFSEILPAQTGADIAARGGSGASKAKSAEALDAANEALVRLSLDSHAPLPTEQLAYGWVVGNGATPPPKPPATAAGGGAAAGDVSAPKPAAAGTAPAQPKVLLYYAAAKDRLRAAAGEQFDTAAFVMPEFLLAPEREPGVWHWLATGGALTAIRYRVGATVPLDVRSWPLDTAGDAAGADDAIRALRASHEPKLHGRHAAGTLVWDGAAQTNSRTLAARWRPLDGGAPKTAQFPVAEAWRADVRERPWLDAARRLRVARDRVRLLLASAAIAWLAALGGWFYTASVRGDLAATRLRERARQAEVDTLNGHSELIAQLEDLSRAGALSFFDALATLNHFRPPGMTFSSATGNARQQVIVQGRAENNSQVTTYIDRLRSTPGYFTEIPDPDMRTTRAPGPIGGPVSSSTTFTLTATIGKLDVARGPKPPSQEEMVRQIETALKPR
jgi:hypothetical protein